MKHDSPANRLPAAAGVDALGMPVLLLLAVAAGMYLAQAFLAIVADRHLYGDASWFLVKLLSENHVAVWNLHGWHDFFRSRYGAFAYQELPTLLAVRLHVRNPELLIRIYGLTLFAFKPLSILLSYRFARDKRLLIFPLLTLVAASMNSEVYIVSETHLMTALFWPALFGLLYCRELKGLDLLWMVIVSAPLLVCYETMAAFGIFLCGACLYRSVALSTSPRDRRLTWILFAWYAAGIVFAVLSIAFPRDVIQRGSFFRGIFFLLHGKYVGAQVSCVVLVLCALIVMVPERHRSLLNAFVAGAVAVALVIPAYIVLKPEVTNFTMHINARTMNASVPLALAVVFVLLFSNKLTIGAAQYRRLFVIAAVLGMCQSGWSLVATTQWSNMLAVLRAELRTHAGPVCLEETRLAPMVVDGEPMRHVHADWPLMSLSILYSAHRTVQTVIVPPAGAFRPFDPYAEASLPDLRKFGFSYQTLSCRLGGNVRSRNLPPRRHIAA